MVLNPPKDTYDSRGTPIVYIQSVFEKDSGYTYVVYAFNDVCSEVCYVIADGM